MAEESKDVLAGVLSAKTGFRVIVNGPYGVKEITNLIAILRLHQRVMLGETIEDQQDDGTAQPVGEQE